MEKEVTPFLFAITSSRSTSVVGDSIRAVQRLSWVGAIPIRVDEVEDRLDDVGLIGGKVKVEFSLGLLLPLVISDEGGCKRNAPI